MLHCILLIDLLNYAVKNRKLVFPIKNLVVADGQNIIFVFHHVNLRKNCIVFVIYTKQLHFFISNSEVILLFVLEVVFYSARHRVNQIFYHSVRPFLFKLLLGFICGMVLLKFFKKLLMM
jgi:hypothetical protein